MRAMISRTSRATSAFAEPVSPSMVAEWPVATTDRLRLEVAPAGEVLARLRTREPIDGQTLPTG